MIGKAIFEILHAKEIETNETAREWVEFLPEILSEINKQAKSRVKKLKAMDPSVRCEGISCELLEEGTKVYVISDQPKDVTGIKLHGKHRITDLKWDPTERTIEQVFRRPYQPPTYRVSGIKGVAYTRPQLMLVKDT